MALEHQARRRRQRGDGRGGARRQRPVIEPRAQASVGADIETKPRRFLGRTAQEGFGEMLEQRGEADLGGVPPSRIKAIYLTHAHMDHCGLIPRMYRLGFSGQVVCTKLTADFVREALKDTVANVDSFDRELYDKRDVDAIRFHCPDESEDFQLGFGYKVPGESDLFYGFSRTGHLAGAVAINFEANLAEGKRLSICFGGDLGPQVLQQDASSSLLRPVQYPRESVDYLVLESTYGGQPRRQPLAYEDKIDALGYALERALSPARGANPRVVIPAFVISELQTAFQMGFLLFLPFLVIDFLVSSVLMALGMMMMPPTTVALPLKLLLFVLVDGWGLVIKSLVASYG